MKRLLSILLSFVMLLSAFAFTSTAYAVEYVTVYLNGTAIDFSSADARPQIINDRTYVPVRATCDALGIEIDWNSKTETMTLTRDGTTIAHTMRSSIVYVNGSAVTFDTPSINLNNRILMPIRMIAESIGATVTWDDPTRSVNITTTGSSSASAAVVSSINASSTAVANDTDITVSAVCSNDTESVKFINTTDSTEIEVVSDYSKDDGLRVFELEYTCENDTDDSAVITIQAVPGIGSSYNTATSACKSVSIIVSAGSSSSSSSSSSSVKAKTDWDIYVGTDEEVDISAILEDDPDEYDWSVEDDDIAEIDENDGIITGVDEGETEIVAEGDTDYTFTVYVDDDYSTDEMTIKGEDTESLEDYLNDEVSEYTFTSDRKAVATVNSKGKVTSVANGIATIICEHDDGSVVQVFVTVKGISDDDDGDYESDYLLSYKVTNDEVKTDDYVKVKVTTESNVKKVKLTTNANNKSSTTTEYTENDDDERVFTCKLQMTKEGDWDVYITLYVSGDFEDAYETFEVSVDDDYDEAEADELEIIDLWTNNSFGYKGYTTTVYVKTSTDIDYLELLTEDQDVGEGKTLSSTAEKYSSYYYWEFDFTVKHTDVMEYTLLAFNEDDEYVSETFDLEGLSAAKSTPAVLEIVQKTSSLIEGEEAKFNVTLTGCVTRLKVTKGTSGTVFDEEFSASSSTSRTYTATFEIPDVNATYYFTAYDEDDDISERVKYVLTGDVEEEIDIRDVDVEDDEVDEDDDIVLTVTTSNSAAKVWVEDSRGSQLSKIYKSPDDIDGSDYIWEIEFSPIDDGRQTFTVVAQDENKEQDTWDFKVTVK